MVKSLTRSSRLRAEPHQRMTLGMVDGHMNDFSDLGSA